MTKIRALVVDDSAVVRQVMSSILNSDPDIKVIATAADPIFAMTKMQVEWPDVIIMDVEMPRMDGITFLRRIMGEHPTPVVVCSALTEAGTKVALEALEAGAAEVITKPRMGLHDYLTESAAALIQAVKAAARANPRRLVANATTFSVPPKLSADVILPPLSARHAVQRGTERLIAIGTSTGGTQALEMVLRALPREIPGIVIVQHMPERFTNAFAARLDSLCDLEIREASDGDRVNAGQAFIAPGGHHLLVVNSPIRGGYQLEVRDGPPVSRHRPSVNVLFRSVARVVGANALGIIMTGMGDDGAEGLLEMHQTGARTVAQDEATCVVYGMPKEAVALGAVDRILPLNDIPRAIVDNWEKPRRSSIK